MKKQLKMFAAALCACVMAFTLAACNSPDPGPDPTSLSTLKLLNNVDGYGMYSMDYLEDYKFDEFLETGAADDDALATFLSEVLLDGMDVEIKAPGIGCSTFSGELKDSGDQIFARNFDFSFAPSLVVTTTPANGYKSISTVNLGFIGYTKTNLPNLEDEEHLLPILVAPYIPLDGINEKGLAIGVLQLNWLSAKQNDPDKINLPTTTMIRMILDKAATVDEAVDLMKEYNIRDSLGANFHYQIADKTGRSVVVEYLNNHGNIQMHIIEKKAGQDYHFATNFYLNENAASVTGMPNGLKHTSTCTRYATMKTVLAANSGIFANEMEAMLLLRDVRQNSTWWSVVYNLEKLTVTFVPARQYYMPPYLFAI